MAVVGGRVLFIVSRREPRLHAYLKEQFTDLPSIDVVMDRRRDGATADGPGGEPERRRRAVDGDLRRFGWAVVKRSAPGR
ncbi:MAG: hypothetical protein ACREK6_06040 [Candidatus Rokuibacteriota bacterium]